MLTGSLAAATFALAQAPATDPVVLTVGSEKITKSQFEQIIDSLPDQQKAQLTTAENRRRLAEQLSELKTLAQEARSKKLDQDPATKTRITMQTEQVLANAAYNTLGGGTPDEAAMKTYFEAHKGEWEVVKARHILIRFQGSRVPIRLGQKDLTEEESLTKTKDLLAQIKGGAKFADLAEKESDDTGSGANGGDLGEFSHGQMVPEFETVAFATPVGQISEPVKSAFGYHIILVEAHTNKSYDDAKQEIAEKIRPDMAQKGLDALKQKVTVVYNDEYFGKP